MKDWAALQQENIELKEQLAQVQRQLDFLVRQVFGRKSEQTPVAAPGQLELELEAQEDDAIENAPPAQPAKRKGGSRKGRKMRAALLPENLPVEQTEIVPLAVQAAPEKWRRIGEEVTEKLERIPGKLIRLRVVRPTYVSIANPFAPPVTAPAPPQLIEGGFFGPHFIADLVLGKYLYHQPLYRQAKALQWECAVDLSPATLCQTIASVADAAGPVVACMSTALWRTGYVQVDLTPVRCLSREHKGGSFLGQMWVSAAVGGDVIYTWDKSKAALVAERIVPDWFRGLLQCDGGSELACFLLGGKGRHKPPPEILRAGCWAHVRRKFFEAAQSGCPIAAKLLKIINTLYRIEGPCQGKQLHARAAPCPAPAPRRPCCEGIAAAHRPHPPAGASQKPRRQSLSLRPGPVGEPARLFGPWPGRDRQQQRRKRHPTLCPRQKKLAVHWRRRRRPAQRHPLQPARQLPAPRHQPPGLSALADHPAAAGHQPDRAHPHPRRLRRGHAGERRRSRRKIRLKAPVRKLRGLKSAQHGMGARQTLTKHYSLGVC